MKNLSSIFLLLCLILPLAGTYTYLHIEKHKVKKALKRIMIEGLDKNQLVLLKLSHEQSKQQLHWEHSKEFEFKGEMYDVVERVHAGDSIIYRCWWDHEETALNKKLMALVDIALGQDRETQNNKSKLDQFFKNLYPPLFSTMDITSYPISREPNHTSSADLIFHSSSPPVPPPELA